jgi:hypothetical protein
MYTGQISRHIRIRASDHVRNTKHENQRSAITKHSTETNYDIDFHITEVNDSAHNYHFSIITEAIKIIKHL